MLIDSHCHVNMIIKKKFDVPLKNQEIDTARTIIEEAHQQSVMTIINVGTSVPESNNCVLLAQKYDAFFACIGLHPSDCTTNWRNDLKEIKTLIIKKEKNKIVGIGECGFDFHYPDYNKQRQADAFKAQIELALEHNLALVVHTRQAYDETLQTLEEFSGQISRGVIHCFSEDTTFAEYAMDMGFVIGIGGAVTYPKSDVLQLVAKTVPLEKIVLETDAPFLPPQGFRGQQNHPKHIATIAHYLAGLRKEPFETVATQTTENTKHLFGLKQKMG